MSKTSRGDVWLADLGMAAKVRPVLVLSVPFADADYALVSVIPHTTMPRGSQFEVKLHLPWLHSGAFNVQGMLAVPEAKFLRKIGTLEPNQLEQLEKAVKRWLGLS
jgi:mRNA interferase MazF